MMTKSQNEMRKFASPELTPEQRVVALMQAPATVLKLFDRMISGEPLPEEGEASLRLLTFAEAAKKLNVSRSTVERLVDAGELDAVVLRKGRRRIREADLRRLVFGACGHA